MGDIVDVLRNWDRDVDGEASPNRIIDKSPFGRDRTKNLLAKLLHNGTVTRTPIKVRGNPTHEYAISNDTET